MSDLKYADGFPANIDKTKLVIVQIQGEQKQGVVLYNCRLTDRQDRCFLPLNLNKIYAENLYVIHPNYKLKKKGNTNGKFLENVNGNQNGLRD